MTDHFLAFRDTFSMDAYVSARRAAAHCRKPEPDLFRFGDLIEQRDELRAEIDRIGASVEGISAGIESMLAAYVPAGIEFNGVATLVVGSPSCGGWAHGPDFSVDLPCLNGDHEGLRYLIAHETYHAIEDPGPYAANSQDVIRTNARRFAQNFALLDVTVVYLRNADYARAAETVRNLGLSGAFDSPFYSVGTVITREIDAAHGRAALLCLLAAGPAEFFAAYAELPA